MRTPEEIEQLAESYLQKNKYNFDNWKEIAHVKQTYIACYTQCQEDMADKWISVNDNKPTQNQYVLLYGKGDRQMTAIYKDNDFLCYDIMTEGLEIAEEITHWMPLPNKPLNKKD